MKNHFPFPDGFDFIFILEIKKKKEKWINHIFYFLSLFTDAQYNFFFFFTFPFKNFIVSLHKQRKTTKRELLLNERKDSLIICNFLYFLNLIVY